DRAQPVLRGDDGVPLPLQPPPEQIAVHLLVFHEKKSRHRVPHITSTTRKPVAESRWCGARALRYAARHAVAWFFHEPPRKPPNANGVALPARAAYSHSASVGSR